MNKSKIEWLNGGYTWNPVTGCLHNCKYCYARRIARRFSGCYDPVSSQNIKQDETAIVRLENNGHVKYKTRHGDIVNAPYPYGFAPTFHSYRLDDPTRIRKPQNIFVCSMADLFGDWIPDTWIQEVFKACEAAPQHRYLFLTKNPRRYEDLYAKKAFPYSENFWFGTTITVDDDYYTWFENTPYKAFVSIEPIMADFGNGMFRGIDWVIVGAETGNRKEKVIPKAEWIDGILESCYEQRIPLFMKDSLKGICKEPLLQEFPWSLEFERAEGE